MSLLTFCLASNGTSFSYQEKALVKPKLIKFNLLYLKVLHFLNKRFSKQVTLFGTPFGK
jgi:hypothetical protein